MVAWSRMIGPWKTGPEADLGHVTGFKTTFRRTGRHEVSFNLPAVHLPVDPLVSDVWLMADGVTVMKWRLEPPEDSGTYQQVTASVQGYDYRELLAADTVLGPNFGWTDTDPALAAWQIIADKQAKPGSDLGIARGVHPATSAVDACSVEVRKPVRDGVDSLAALDPGFDWDLTPTSVLDLAFDVWRPGRGTDRGEVIDLGGRAMSYSRRPDVSAYGNAGVWSGQAPSDASSQLDSPLTTPTFAFVSVKTGDGTKFRKGMRVKVDNETMLITSVSGDALSVTRGYAGTAGATHATGAQITGVEPQAIRVAAADIATRPEGRWEYVESTDQTTDSALAAYSAKSLTEHQLPPVTWTATLVRGWWQGPAHLWLGDPFTWVCKPRSGWPDVLQTFTVEELSAEFPSPSLVDRRRRLWAPGDPDPEAPKVDLTFGLPPRGARYRVLNVDRRLSRLENR